MRSIGDLVEELLKHLDKLI